MISAADHDPCADCGHIRADHNRLKGIEVECSVNFCDCNAFQEPPAPLHGMSPADGNDRTKGNPST